MPARHVDNVGDGGGGEQFAEFAPPLSDPAGGVAPSVDDLRLTDDGEVLSEGRRPRDDCRAAVAAGEPEYRLHGLIVAHMREGLVVGVAHVLEGAAAAGVAVGVDTLAGEGGELFDSVGLHCDHIGVRHTP